MVLAAVSVICQPGGGPGSARHSRAENTRLHPHDSTNLVSDTPKLPAGLFTQQGDFITLANTIHLNAPS